MSTQVPLQSVSPAWHESSHTPKPLQTSPGSQGLPQAPQLARLVSVSTQVPLQSVRPTWLAGAGSVADLTGSQGFRRHRSWRGYIGIDGAVAIGEADLT